MAALQGVRGHGASGTQGHGPSPGPRGHRDTRTHGKAKQRQSEKGASLDWAMAMALVELAPPCQERPVLRVEQQWRRHSRGGLHQPLVAPAVSERGAGRPLLGLSPTPPALVEAPDSRRQGWPLPAAVESPEAARHTHLPDSEACLHWLQYRVTQAIADAI